MEGAGWLFSDMEDRTAIGGSPAVDSERQSLFSWADAMARRDRTENEGGGPAQRIAEAIGRGQDGCRNYHGTQERRGVLSTGWS